MRIAVMADTDCLSSSSASPSVGCNDDVVRQSVSSRPALAPHPNPPFVFPAPLRDVEADHDQSGSNILPQRMANRSRPQRISIDPLPSFSFPLPQTPPRVESPQPSPGSSSPTRRRGHHKRWNSELIGGDPLASVPVLFGPPKPPFRSDAVPPSPPAASRRRGHAHRRSGAISNHDVSSIIKPAESMPVRSGSAPSTPADPNAHENFLSSSEGLPLSLSTEQDHNNVSPFQKTEVEPISQTTPFRPRVGFSDTLEYIPRPLSTVSSATSGSLSTLRASHSLTGSVTSIRSLGSHGSPRPKTSPTSSPGNGLSSSVSNKDDSSGDNLSQFHEASPNSELTTHTFSINDTVQSKESVVAYPSCANINKSSEPDRTPFQRDLSFPLETSYRFSRGFQTSDNDSAASILFANRPRSSPEPKCTKRQGKGKSWGFLLPRKQHPDGGQAEIHQSTQNHFASEFAPLEEFSLDDVNFDEDNTCVIRSPGYDSPSTIPCQAREQPKLEETSANQTLGVLDLDATWDSIHVDASATNGTSSGRRRFRSGGPNSGYLNYGKHRRTESAPAMTIADSSFGVYRLGNGSQMADVFEEDEEEGDDQAHTKTAKATDVMIKMKHDSTVAHSTRKSNGSGPESETFDSGKKRSNEDLTVPYTVGNDIQSVLSGDSAAHQSVNECNDPLVEIVDAAEEPRFSVGTKSSDESTVAPAIPDTRFQRQIISSSSPVDCIFPTPSFAPSDASTADPSPDPTQTSFEVPRLNTAHSSMTDRSLWNSARVGECGVEIAHSVDDIPSLTSSASTMISHPVPFSPIFGSRLQGERASSLSVVTPRQGHSSTTALAHKRASLVSLSRLVGGSLREGSKLSIESRPREDEAGQKGERKKRKGISKLMRFWRSKEDMKE